MKFALRLLRENLEWLLVFLLAMFALFGAPPRH